MTLGPSELETSIRETLDRYFVENADVLGDGPRLWRALAEELGVLGAALPKEAGGLGGGHAEIGATMEMFGRHLAVSPYLSTVVIGARLLQVAAPSQVSAMLESVGQGALHLAVAYAEAESGHNPARVDARARKVDGRYVLNGEKVLVLHAASAQRLVVVARTAGEADDRAGLSLFLVDAAAAGLTRRDYRTIDGAPASDLRFDGTPALQLIGEEGAAIAPLERVLDEATVAVCAEACGVLQKLVDLTVDYTRQRRQFGRAIAEFQVLQHRMVDMLVEVKQSAILTRMARLKLDGPEREAAVSAAKSRVGRACRLVSQAAVQLHGGIGIAEEAPVSRYFRRALMIEQQFGSVDYHLERYERLQLPAARRH